MKKILISSALLAALSTSAFAENGSVYFRLDGGLSMLSSPAEKDYFENKFSGSNTPFINLGVGYYFGESVRVDLNFMYHFNNDTDKKFLRDADLTRGPVAGIRDGLDLFPGFIPSVVLDIPGQVARAATYVDVAAGRAGAVGDPIRAIQADVALGLAREVGDVFGVIDASKVKVAIADIKVLDVQNTFKMFSVMPRVYFDLFDYGNGKIFVGAGLGYANLKNEITVTAHLVPKTAEYFNNLVKPELGRLPARAAVALVAPGDLVDGHDAITALDLLHPTLPADFDVAKAAAAVLADTSLTFSSPSKGNFAFSLHAGMDYKIPSMEGVKLNIEYSYANYGQIKQITVGNVDVDLPNPLKINMSNISLGLRIEM